MSSECAEIMIHKRSQYFATARCAHQVDQSLNLNFLWFFHEPKRYHLLVQWFAPSRIAIKRNIKLLYLETFQIGRSNKNDQRESILLMYM